MESSELGRFEAAVLPHLDAAYTLARYLTRNAHDAKDVVQDASLRALKYADQHPEGELLQESAKETLGRALDRLALESREVIVLRELERLSYKEISEVAGVPVGTVMSRLSRGRTRLQEALGNEEGS